LKDKEMKKEDVYITMGCYIAVRNPKHLMDIISGNALVPSLDGSGKMSKTGNPKHTIFLRDTPEQIREKISKIPSDPEHWHVFFGLHWKLLGEKEKEMFLKDLAKRTIWYSGADLEAMVREAALFALRKSIDAKHVTKEDFEESFRRRKQSISKQTIDTYKKIEENFLKQTKSTAPASSSYFG